MLQTKCIQEYKIEDSNKKDNTNSDDYLKNNDKKLNWTQEEDKHLLLLTEDFGLDAWRLIKNIYNKKFYNNKKSAKNLRERFNKISNKTNNNSSWTFDEEKVLFENQLIYGNRWSLFTKLFPGRSDNNIKNHFYSKYRKKVRKILKFVKRNSNQLLLTDSLREYLKTMDFKSLHDTLHEKKVLIKDLTITNIFKIAFNLNENTDLHLLNSLELLSNAFLAKDETTIEDILVGKNYKLFNDIDKNEQRQFTSFNKYENLNNNTYSNKTTDSSKYMEMDSEETLTDY